MKRVYCEFRFSKCACGLYREREREGERMSVRRRESAQVQKVNESCGNRERQE